MTLPYISCFLNGKGDTGDTGDTRYTRGKGQQGTYKGHKRMPGDTGKIREFPMF